ncbi:TRAP transporter small permease [Roseinatronobacter sp. NSM]|uniref:TRAP transporter small permease n=1 Tax=Roseinatronobacter sp. NSM TaxID=3457785 RepID=UPI004035718A
MMRLLHLYMRAVELVAAVLLGAVTLLVVASTLGRYVFALPVPDSFDFSRLLLGACLAWGFAVIGLRGGHVQVDIVAQTVSPRIRQAIDALAWAFLLCFAILVAWKMLGRVDSARLSGETTFDLRIPIWPFLGLIWAGIAASVVTISIKLVRIITGHEQVDSSEDIDFKEVTRGLR